METGSQGQLLFVKGPCSQLSMALSGHVLNEWPWVTILIDADAAYSITSYYSTVHSWFMIMIHDSESWIIDSESTTTTSLLLHNSWLTHVSTHYHHWPLTLSFTECGIWKFQINDSWSMSMTNYWYLLISQMIVERIPSADRSWNETKLRADKGLRVSQNKGTGTGDCKIQSSNPRSRSMRALELGFAKFLFKGTFSWEQACSLFSTTGHWPFCVRWSLRWLTCLMQKASTQSQKCLTKRMSMKPTASIVSSSLEATMRTTMTDYGLWPMTMTMILWLYDMIWPMIRSI